MNVKSLLGFALSFSSFYSIGWTAPSPQMYPESRSYQTGGEDPQSILRQLKTSFSSLKNTLNNHENEIRTFENKLTNQENAFDHIRQQLADEQQSQKDTLRAYHLNTENKLTVLEQSIKQLEMTAKSSLADLRQLSTQANDSVNMLAQHQKKLIDLEQQIENQKQHLQHIEVALQSMMELIQIKETASSPEKTYKVQAGDFLEKIAREHQVSLKALREANPQVVNDRIFQGQVLTIP